MQCTTFVQLFQETFDRCTFKDRWTGHLATVLVVIESSIDLISLLTELDIVQALGPEIRMEAAGLLRELSELSFLFIAHFVHKILYCWIPLTSNSEEELRQGYGNRCHSGPSNKMEMNRKQEDMLDGYFEKVVVQPLRLNSNEIISFSRARKFCLQEMLCN